MQATLAGRSPQVGTLTVDLKSTSAPTRLKQVNDPDTSDGPSRRPIRPTDLCRLRSVTEVTLHPNASVVVYGIGWPDAERDANRSQLYAVGVDGIANRQLSFGHRDSAPVFSADGTRLAFLRSEPEHPTKVMVLSWPVGETIEVASFADGAGRIAWLDDDRLAVVAAQRPEDHVDVDDAELARRPRILTTLNYRFNGRGFIHDRPNQIFVVTATVGGTPVPIGTDGIDHGSVAVSPDGHSIAAIGATDDDADLTGSNHVWLYSVSGDHDPIRLTDPGGDFASVLWHPDGRLIATGSLDVTVTGFHRPYLVDVHDGSTTKVSVLGDHDQHVVPSFSTNGQCPVDGGVLYPGVRSGRVAIDRYDLESGARSVIHEGHHQATAFSSTPDGSVVVAAITSPERPAELWRVDGTAHKLVSLNDAVLDQLDLGSTEVVSVTSADGTAVEAFVVRPPASAPETGAARPGLVYIHGGPMFMYGLSFFDEFQMAAACGYVVIGSNPRGSDGYGEAWSQAIIGDLGNRDQADITAITDHLAALPEVDGDRIGIGGGSYGGFLTSWMLGHDNRYRAGLVERAVTSWNSFVGTSDIGTWFTTKTIGATVEDRPDEVTRQSPLHYAANITAPTLIIHSEEDWRCPIEQAEQLFSAIRRTGGTTTFVRFPGENHELTRSGKPLHRIERLEIVHEFYARHLGGGDFGSSHLGDG